MAIKLRNTNDVHANGIKMLVYGGAGYGKTSLIKTLPNPVVLSAEAGLLSLAGTNLPYMEINCFEDLQEAYEFVLASEYESIALDSISEIAETVLNYEKKQAKDPRQAYGAMQEKITDLIRAFRDIPGKNVYFSAKMEKFTDEMGMTFYGPSMPGNKTTQGLPYFFDEVLALRLFKEADSDGNETTQRALQCHPDSAWTAKDRSGRLEQWEQPDLGAIINKIKGVNNE